MGAMETDMDGATRRGLPTAEIKASGVIVFIVGLGLMGQAYSERFYLGSCCTRPPPDYILPFALRAPVPGLLGFVRVFGRGARDGWPWKGPGPGRRIREGIRRINFN